MWTLFRNESLIFFVCVTRPVPTVGMQTVHQDPKRWACGRRSTASPSSVSTVRLNLHRTGACGTMLHHLRTRTSHLMYRTARALVGPCCTICAREQATIRTRESVEPCCAEGAHHITEAQTITSTLETLFPGRWHHVATPVAAEVVVVVSLRRACHEQQEKYENT